MNPNRNASVIVGLSLLLGLPILRTIAGPLDPPAGPVSETGRRMILSLPYLITSPGSYVVQRDLVRTTGGITVAANDVTIDLNGFRLDGGSTFTGTSGINLDGTTRVTVRNGSITRWGVGLSGPTATDSHLEDLHIVDCGASSSNGYGMNLGNRAVVSRCYFSGSYRGDQVGLYSRVLNRTFTNAGGPLVAKDDSEVGFCYCTAGSPSPSTVSVGASSRVHDCRVIGSLAQAIATTGGDVVVCDNKVSNGMPGGTCVVLTGTGSRVFRNVFTSSNPTPVGDPGGNDVGPLGTAGTATSPWANLIH